ncbi:acyltransferase family protein [Shewanella marina]|uniref:acyltransferase family protein n=1 Tax=Shewanella marina TaxID=487319 RepID=UPI0004729EA5
MFYSIQLLRILSALLVVIYHACNKVGLEGVFKFGQMGVDIFFIISGFVIYISSCKKVYSPIKFLRNRFFRIYPIYWLFTFIAFIAYIIYPSLVNSGRETSILNSIFLLPSDKPYLINNAWTLVYEMFFYFIFSLFITLKNKYRVIGTSIVIVLLLSVRYFFPNLSSNLYFYFYSDYILLEFLFGVMFAYFYVTLNINKWVFTVLALVLSFFYIYIYSLSETHRLFYYGIPSFIIFYIVVSLEGYILKSNIKNIVDALGNCSYVLYLLHPFILVLVYKLFQKHYILSDIGLIIVMLISSLFVSMFVHQYIEKRITKYIRKYS